MPRPIPTIIALALPTLYALTWFRGLHISAFYGAHLLDIQIGRGIVKPAFASAPCDWPLNIACNTFPASMIGSATTIHLAVTTLACVAPALVVAFWRRRKHGDRLCAACGYDLRATPERCPECGRTV